jgi:tyrosinase
MSRKTSRRQFLKTTGAAASAAILSNRVLDLLDGGTSAFAAPMVRKNIKNLSATDPIIVAYKAGIAAMKALPSSDHRHWTNWANMHGAPNGASGPLWNTCQHGQWWFLPWHRMYIHFFEAIIRKLSNSPSFTLPYWDYSDPNDSGQRAIPSMFRTPTTGNQLYVSHRNSIYNGGALLPTFVVSTTAAMASTKFTGPAGTSNNFGGQTVSGATHLTGPHGLLESVPHDQVHGTIGGWMGDVNMAARDPIFWLHHSNIDRLWNAWLAKGGLRVDPPSLPWCDLKFNFFDDSGNPVSMTVREVINAAAQLNYVYEGEPSIPTQTCPQTATPIVAAAAAESFTLASKTIVTRAIAGTIGAARTRVSLPVPTTMNARAMAMEAIAQPEQALVLRIEGITVDQSPDTVWEVYVGLPADAKPDPEGPFFVGSLSAFGATGSHAGHGGFTAAFPIGAAMASALEGGGASTSVTFIPVTVELDGKQTMLMPKTNVHFTQLRVVQEPR